MPFTNAPFPSPYTVQNAAFVFAIFGMSQPYLEIGSTAGNAQRQINVVDGLSVEKGSHSLKFGIDYRRLAPSHDPGRYTQAPVFLNVPSAVAGNLGFASLQSLRSSTFLLQNLGLFAQDTWRMNPRLTITYGLRWDVDFAPSSTSGPSIPAVTGYDLGNLTNLALAPAGTSPFTTRFGNVAPRVGVAYQLSQSQHWGRVIRGGFGVFYDLATSEVGNTLGVDYPFGASGFVLGPGFGGTATFPLSATDAAAPSITPAQLASPGAVLLAFDPHLNLPYTLEWNVALEQELGKEQSVTASYIGSDGRRLLQTAYVASPNANFANAALIGNTATSDYNACRFSFSAGSHAAFRFFPPTRGRTRSTTARWAPMGWAATMFQGSPRIRTADLRIRFAQCVFSRPDLRHSSSEDEWFGCCDSERLVAQDRRPGVVGAAC